MFVMVKSSLSCAFPLGLTPLSCIYITLNAHNSKSFIRYLCILFDDFPFIGSGYQPKTAARIPLYMDGSGIIDELDGAFSSPGRCLPVIHGDKPHPRPFHPFPAVPQTGPQDGQVETEFAVLLLHVLVVPVFRDAEPPVFVHDVHKTADDAVICFHFHFFL